MENRWYAVYALILGIVSFFTGELVTFIMLGFILMTLININLSPVSALVSVALCTAGLLFGLCIWAYWTYLNRNVGQTGEGV